MSNTQRNADPSTTLSLTEITRLFCIETNKKVNVIRILLNLEEKLNSSLDVDRNSFYAMVSQGKLENALE